MDKKEDKIPAPFIKDKRFKKKYAKQLIEYVNQVIRPDEQHLYKELVKAILEENDLDKPQDLMMLDVSIYDFLRIKRIQSVLMEQGDVKIVKSKAGNEYTNINKAGYLLNAVENQLRQNLKELALSRKERMKKKLGVDRKDFASFMSEPVEVDVVEDDKNE